MPISTECNALAQLWMLTTGESFTLSEVAELSRETDWKGCRRYVWDLRQLLRGPDSTDEIQDAVDLAKDERQSWAGSRVAIVVARDFDFGIARMVQTYAEGAGIHYEVFREHDAALDWVVGRQSSIGPAETPE